MGTMMQMYWRHVAIFFVAALFVAGCASTKPSGVHERLLDYHINDVRVSFADTVDTGFGERMDNEDDRDFLERVRKSIEKIVHESIKSSLDGANPADVSMTLTKVDIASGPGRALGHDSKIIALVEISDASSGIVLAEKSIIGEDDATGMGGNVGGLISLLSNVTNAVITDRVTSVVRDVSDQLKYWIEN